MISIEDLEIRFGENCKAILSGVDVSVKKGKNTLIIGKSGSGKTKLLETIMGIIPEIYVKKGKFFVDNKELTYKEYKEHKIHKTFSAIFQDAVHSLHPYRTIEKQCQVSSATASDVFKKFRLNYSHIKDEYPKNLSGGQCQRISILFPYLLKRDIIIFDEPVTDIDSISMNTILDIIREEFFNNSEKTVIYVTHSYEELSDINFNTYKIENKTVTQRL